MEQALTDILDSQRTRLFAVLEDCRCLAGMGDFRQAAARFAEFRGDLDSLFNAEERYAQRALRSIARRRRCSTPSWSNMNGPALSPKRRGTG